MTADWLTAVSGNWTEAVRWSSNPDYPNIATSTSPWYDARIAAAGADYTVTLNSTVTVINATVDAPTATLSQTGGIFSVTGRLDIQAGTYELKRGTIWGATLRVGAGGQFVVNGSGSLDQVTLESDLTIGGYTALGLGRGSSLNGHVIHLVGTSGTSALTLDLADPAVGGGEVIFGGSGSNTLSLGRGPAAIPAGITVRTGTAGGSIGQYGWAATNRGAISAQTPGASIILAGSN